MASGSETGGVCDPPGQIIPVACRALADVRYGETRVGGEKVDRVGASPGAGDKAGSRIAAARASGHEYHDQDWPQGQDCTPSPFPFSSRPYGIFQTEHVTPPPGGKMPCPPFHLAIFFLNRNKSRARYGPYLWDNKTKKKQYLITIMAKGNYMNVSNPPRDSIFRIRMPTEAPPPFSNFAPSAKPGTYPLQGPPNSLVPGAEDPGKPWLRISCAGNEGRPGNRTAPRRSYQYLGLVSTGSS